MVEEVVGDNVEEVTVVIEVVEVIVDVVDINVEEEVAREIKRTIPHRQPSKEVWQRNRELRHLLLPRRQVLLLDQREILGAVLRHKLSQLAQLLQCNKSELPVSHR